MLPAGLRGSSCFRAVRSKASTSAAASARQQRRLVAVRAAAEEKGEFVVAADADGFLSLFTSGEGPKSALRA